jgi:glyoxylase-like metal-dependent hydrolase (beta-lactamase superfamily II)
MKVQAFYDERTSTLSYVAFDEARRIGVVIDPVLDFDPASGRTWTESADAVTRFLETERIQVPYVLETHAHADHLSAMPIFKARFGAKTVIGSGIGNVQKVFRDIFNLGDAFPTDGRQFDVLVDDDERLDVGPFEVRAIHTPGHTPGCMSYLAGNALFVGDALFQPDYGTARCDFPGGSASDLYDSIQRLYATLPDDTRIFTCHDYQPDGRALEFESTLAEQRSSNVQLSEQTRREEFVAFRKERDATLAMPALIIPAVQVNIRAGELPEPEDNGIAYLKLPVNTFGGGR